MKGEFSFLGAEEVGGGGGGGEIGKPLTLASTFIQDYTQPDNHITPTYDGVQPINYTI